MDSACINERQESLWDGLHQSLVQFLILVNLSPPLIDHQSLDPSHRVLPKVFLFPPNPFFLSVITRTLNTFMLRSANWNMMIPLIWLQSVCLDLLDHLCITNIWLLPNFRGRWHFKNSDSHSILRD